MAMCFRFDKENPRYTTVGELLRNAIESIVIPTEKATRDVYITRWWHLYDSSAKPVSNEILLTEIQDWTTLYLRKILEIN